jgi:hypothetical protein
MFALMLVATLVPAFGNGIINTGNTYLGVGAHGYLNIVREAQPFFPNDPRNNFFIGVFREASATRFPLAVSAKRGALALPRRAVSPLLVTLVSITAASNALAMRSLAPVRCNPTTLLRPRRRSSI